MWEKKTNGNFKISQSKDTVSLKQQQDWQIWWTPESKNNKVKFWKKESESEVAQSCLTLYNPVDCSLPGSSVHGILQARILEWVSISFSRGTSRPRDWTQVSCIAGRCFNLRATREANIFRHTKIERICYQ